MTAPSPWGEPAPVGAPLAPAPSPVPHRDPDEPAEAWQPRTYPQLLRGPQHRWWRPLVGLAVMIGLVLVLFVLSSIAVLVALVASGFDLMSMTGDIPTEVLASPALFTVNNLFLASFIPAGMVAVWVGHRWRPRWVSSVVPRLRWRWMLGVTAICLVVQVLGTAVFWAIDGAPSGEPDEQALALLICVLLTTPLQCAGEEYLCRGWLTQMIGSWFSRALLAVLVSGLVSALVFAAMHSIGAEQNLALFLDRFAFGVLASYLTWRTGGLEAAIGAHTANNVIVMVPAILTGTLDDSLGVSEAPWSMVGLDVVVMLVVGGAVTGAAHLARVRRVHDPELQPRPAPPPPAVGPWGPPPPGAWVPPPPAAWSAAPTGTTPAAPSAPPVAPAWPPPERPGTGWGTPPG